MHAQLNLATAIIIQEDVPGVMNLEYPLFHELIVQIHVIKTQAAFHLST